MIKLQAIGHLGKDCVVNQVSGKTVINFSVAHSEKFKDSAGNQQAKTIWVECSWWTDKTNIAQWLKKGTQVHVDGNPEVRTYPKNDGTMGVSLSLRVLSLQLLGSAQGDGHAQAAPQQYQAQPAGAPPSYTQGGTVNGGPAYVGEPVEQLPF